MPVESIAGGRYRVERTLGNGAMARVLLARDSELGRPVALKVLDERLAADDAFRARFSREARVAASVSHPNLVTVFDVGEHDGLPFIVMEYVEGRTLHDRLQAEGTLPPADVRRVALQVARGLEHAHASGLVHRDLKPGNLIEREDGTIKIADFGVARAVEGTDLTEAGTIVGTAAYLAPEQAEGRPVSPETDSFALGVVLYELLTGRPPWAIDSLAALAARAEAVPPELPPDVPDDLRAVVEACLSIDPDDRPSAAAIAARLEAPAAEEGATMVLPRTTTARAASRGRRRTPRRRTLGATPWLIVLLAVLVLGLVGLGALIAGGGDSGDGNGATPTPERAEIEPLQDGATPEEDARLLAEWLRANSR